MQEIRKNRPICQKSFGSGGFVSAALACSSDYLTNPSETYRICGSTQIHRTRMQHEPERATERPTGVWPTAEERSPQQQAGAA